MSKLSFHDRIDKAVKIVRNDYPEAQLYRVEAYASRGLTNNPDYVDIIDRMVFTYSDNATIFIYENELGKFSKPELDPRSWLDDIVIAWPIKMKIDDAAKIKVNAGHTEPFRIVFLRHPILEDLKNPCFIFGGNPNEPDIYVDTVTKKITCRNKECEINR